jgi:hypothetical protein
MSTFVRVAGDPPETAHPLVARFVQRATLRSPLLACVGGATASGSSSQPSKSSLKEETEELTRQYP